MTTSQNNKNALLDPRLYVQSYFNLNNLTIQPNGSVKGYKTEASLFNKLILDYTSDFKAFAAVPSNEKPKALPEKLLQHALSEYIDLEVKVAINKSLDSIAFTGNHNTAPLAKWVKAVTGAENPLDIAVMGHFAVQVKRKALGLKVSNHMMPIVYNKVHGGGKTESVKALFSPLKDLYLSLTLEEAADEKIIPAFQDNYICFLDEVAKSERASLSNLKRIICSETLDTRILKTNRTTKVDVNVTFIGTSNRPVNEIIYDDGMRRYYQIDALPKLDWEAINSIDYLQLWQCINHEHDFLTPVWKELKAAQAGLATMDHVDEFLIECGLLTDSPKIEVSLTKIYADYVLFSGDSGVKPLTKFFLAKKLRSHKLESVNKKIDGKTSTCFLVPVGSIIDGKAVLGVAK
jgi:hypothetical protein